MASSFPSAAPIAERAPAARAWHDERQLSPRGVNLQHDHNPQPQDLDSEEGVQVGSPAERRHVSPAGTDASSLSHSNAEISLHPAETASEGGSCAASEDMQRRDGDAASEEQQTADREDDTATTEPARVAQATVTERRHDQEEIAAAEPLPRAVQRSPRRLQQGGNEENVPAQGRGWVPAGARRGGGRQDAVSAAQKLDFESARPSPIAPLGKAAAANWLQSRR